MTNLREARGALPENLADAVTAVCVARNYRVEDALTVAKLLAPSYETRWWVPAKDLFTLIVAHLEHDGAKAAEAVIDSRRKIELARSGDTNVIKVSIGAYQDGTVKARVLYESNVRAEEQSARRAFHYLLTERAIENDNDPEPVFSHAGAGARGYLLPYGEKPGVRVSPGLWTRMKVQGLLARIMAQPLLRIRDGAWEGGDPYLALARENGERDG